MTLLVLLTNIPILDLVTHTWYLAQSEVAVWAMLAEFCLAVL